MQNTLPIMEAFYTLQGEGFYSGNAAYFIRLAGCDVGCVWCDVKDSWDATKHKQFTIDEIVEMVNNKVDYVYDNGEKFIETKSNISATTKPLVVITGGEPLLHQLDELTFKLQQQGYTTNIETSGSSPMSGNWNWICLSPKKFKAPLPNICNIAHELKIVVFNKSDFDWAEKYAALVNENCKLYLQPEWDKSKEIVPLIIDYIKENPKWQLSLQTHKYLRIP